MPFFKTENGNAENIKYDDTKSVKEVIDDIKDTAMFIDSFNTDTGTLNTTSESGNSSGNQTASSVTFDNTDTGLEAANVQDAIEEVNGKLSTNEVEFLGQFTSANPNVTDTKTITDLSKYKQIILITYSTSFKYGYNPISIPYELFKIYGNEIISYASNFFATMKYISDTQIGIRTNSTIAYIYGVK